MIKPTPKNQDGKLYQDMPDQGSLVLVRRKDKIHGCFIQNNKLLRLTTDEEKDHMEGTVCIAKVMDIVPNIHAAFLRINEQCKAFISLDDLQKGYNLSRPHKPIVQGDAVLVCITKEASKGKEASATCRIRFEGELCVVSLGANGLSFSKKLNKDLQSMLKYQLQEANFALPDYMQLIVRTKAESVLAEELLSEAEQLIKKANDFLTLASHRSDYSVLIKPRPNYQNFIAKLDDFQCRKILTDDAKLYQETLHFLEEHHPDSLDKLHFYEDCLVPLNVLYGLEGKFLEAVSDKVWLKCGGFLYIEPTQALTVIDVNSGKYDKKSASEDTFFAVNLDAAQEIANQIFLRNLTGIIIVDFINMGKQENKEKLLQKLTECLQKDRNPGKVLGYTRLGLIEITRKKSDKTIYEQILV